MSLRRKEFCIADAECIWYDCVEKTNVTAQFKAVVLYEFDKTIFDRKQP